MVKVIQTIKPSNGLTISENITMKKAINKKFGDVEAIEIIDVDKPKLATDEVLIKVMAAGLNPKDILVRKGKFKRLTGSKFPQGIGYDFSGIVEQANGSDFKKGDKVFGMLNGMLGRSCAEYVNVKAEELFKMPEQISFEAAAGVPLAGQTSLQAIRNLGNLEKGQKILINGASGGVGTLAIQIAKEFGGVVTTISSTKNLDFCKSFGADEVCSYQEIDILKSNHKFDIFYDVFGNYSYPQAAPLLNSKGIYITTVPKVAILKEKFFNLFRQKKGKLVVVKSNKKDLQWIYEKINTNKIKPVVDQVFNFNDIKDAQKYIESKRAKGKVILKMNTSN